MEKYPILILVTCSNHKLRSGEVRNYDSASSIQTFLSPDTCKNFYNKRYFAYSQIHNQKLLRDGKTLDKFPLNENLVCGPDIHLNAKEFGKYLPAVQRYEGRFFTELGNPDQKLALFDNARLHLIIISGLYGLLLPSEKIQSYSFNINDSDSVRKSWTEGDFLTKTIIEYKRKNNISLVIEMIGDDSYKELINWNLLSNEMKGNVLHAYSKQYSAPDILIPLGDAAKILLTLFSESDFYEDTTITTSNDIIYFRRFVVPENQGEFAFSPLNPKEKTSYIDKIGRMRRNIAKHINLIYEKKHISKYENHEIKEKSIRNDVNKLHSLGIIHEVERKLLIDFLDDRNNVEYTRLFINSEEITISYQEYLNIINRYEHIIESLKKIHGNSNLPMEKI
jgi:hypothetical protein